MAETWVFEESEASVEFAASEARNVVSYVHLTWQFA